MHSRTVMVTRYGANENEVTCLPQQSTAIEDNDGTSLTPTWPSSNTTTDGRSLHMLLFLFRHADDLSG